MLGFKEETKEPKLIGVTKQKKMEGTKVSLQTSELKSNIITNFIKLAKKSARVISLKIYNK